GRGPPHRPPRRAGRPFPPHGVGAEEIAHELAAVAVAPPGAEAIQRPHQPGRKRDREPDCSFLVHGSEMYWISRRSCGITFPSMFVRPCGLFSARLLAGLALLVGMSTAGAVTAQETPPKTRESPPQSQDPSPRPDE